MGKWGRLWVGRVIVQHWWSLAGANGRDDINITDLHHVLRYRLTPITNIGFGPNIRINWNASRSGDKLTLPVGLGADSAIKIGPLPAKIGIEGYYFVASPDAFGPQWARKPLCGKYFRHEAPQ